MRVNTRLAARRRRPIRVEMSAGFRRSEDRERRTRSVRLSLKILVKKRQGGVSEQAGKDTQSDPMIDGIINPSLSLDRAFADQNPPTLVQRVDRAAHGRGRRPVLPSLANPSSIRNKTFPNRHCAAALWIDERMATLLTLYWPFPVIILAFQ